MLKDRLAGVKAMLKRAHLWRIQGHASLRAALQGQKLAPGTLKMLPHSSMADQLFFSKEASKHGPIFKVWWTNKLTTCIVGHDLGRRFLSVNEGKIRAATIDLTPLFPHGFLRAMEGETHRKYRRMFIDAFRFTPLEAHDQQIRSIIDTELSAFADGAVANAATMRPRLKAATMAISLRLILGIEQSSPRYNAISAAYESYAPDAPFLVVRNRHKEAYIILKEHVADLVGSPEVLERAPASLLKALVTAGNIDDTVIGNLIQMTEASLYDMHGLWFWIVHMLSTDPSVSKTMQEYGQGNALERDFAVAIAQEALRMEQSEFIHRVAVEDIVFNGHFIPKKSRIRICVWDGHRDAAKFADPFRFDPTRFLKKKPDIDTYSPFGLDKHRCLGADWTIELAATFVEQLSKRYRLDLVKNGPSERGKFHFEPSSDFEVKLNSAATV